ncbi:MAG: hypothetical protein K2N39_12460 [Lachnospiraceae bacterium]|nr:hypothetical protein [Lachnospiraceae bacterium]
MTLEAAFALPFFLFAVLNILFAVNMIGTQSRINAALHQVGNRLAFAGYAYENTVGDMLPDGLSGVMVTEGYARGQIVEYVGRSYLDHSCVKGGAGGLSFVGSSVMGAEDIIDLKISYRVRPFAGLMGFDGFSVSQRYYGRAWTGYDAAGTVNGSAEEDPMVYITKTGTAYHMDRSCSYLNPKIETVSAQSVPDRRNASGAKYVPCGSCGAAGGGNQVYITSYGSSYHKRLDCPGLKRTIYTVPLSEAGARGRCSKCG